MHPKFQTKVYQYTRVYQERKKRRSSSPNFLPTKKDANVSFRLHPSSPFPVSLPSGRSSFPSSSSSTITSLTKDWSTDRRAPKIGGKNIGQKLKPRLDLACQVWDVISNVIWRYHIRCLDTNKKISYRIRQ